MLISDKIILKTLVKNDDALKIIAKELNVNITDLKDYINKIDNKLALFIDGGARGNPGESGIGIITVDEKIKKGHYYYLGNATNNEAEYKALIQGLKLAILNQKEIIEVFSDSELLCNQIIGKYKIKSSNLLTLYKEAVILINKFKSFNIEYIPREKNKEADRLVNIAIDSKTNGEIELTVVPKTAK